MEFLSKLKISKIQSYDVIVLFLLSLCVRLFYVHKRFWLAGDSADYLDIAGNLAVFKSFAFTAADGSLMPTAFRPLLYPLLISLFWNDPSPPLNEILLIQSVLGAATAVLVYLIAKESFSRKVSVIASLLFSFSPLMLQYTATIMTESLFIFLTVLSIFFMIKKRFLWAGVFFGLAFLARPIILPFLLFIVLLSFFSHITRKFSLHFIGVLLLAVLVASPWIIRNSFLFDKLTLTQSSGYGTNIYFGSIETPLWKSDNNWTDFFKQSVPESPPGLDEAADDRWRMKFAIEQITENPLGWLKVRAQQYPMLYIDNCGFLLGNNNMQMRQAFNEGKYYVIIVKLSFVIGSVIVLLLAILGLWFLRKDFFNYFYIWVFPVFLALIHLPMWIESRYFLPALPFFYILTTIGALVLYENLQTKFSTARTGISAAQNEILIPMDTGKRYQKLFLRKQ